MYPVTSCAVKSSKKVKLTAIGMDILSKDQTQPSFWAFLTDLKTRLKATSCFQILRSCIV